MIMFGFGPGIIPLLERLLAFKLLSRSPLELPPKRGIAGKGRRLRVDLRPLPAGPIHERENGALVRRRAGVSPAGSRGVPPRSKTGRMPVELAGKMPALHGFQLSAFILAPYVWHWRGPWLILGI